MKTVCNCCLLFAHDFSGSLCQVLEGIETRRGNAVDTDVLGNSHLLTAEKAVFWPRLLKGRAETISLLASETPHPQKCFAVCERS